MSGVVCRGAASVLLLGLLLLTAGDARAEAELEEADRAAIRSVIRAQLKALERDDAEEAFSYAAPAIQKLFGTPQHFLAMVKGVYRPLYRPRSVLFLSLEVIAGELTQKVLVVGEDGEPRIALFLMDRQPDGSWKILGCVLRPVSLEVASTTTKSTCSLPWRSA